MTESEAREKWCPKARVVFSRSGGAVDDGQTAFNRVQEGAGTSALYGMSNASKCIASECMMWMTQKGERPGNSSGYCGLVRK